MHDFNYGHVAEQRKKYIPYQKVEEFVDPGNGDVILDIGAGDGFYSINFARKIVSGRVIAVELDKRATSLIEERKKTDSIPNVEIVNQDVCRNFPFREYTKVFFSNSFHDLPCREELLKNISSSSASGVQIFFIEFKKEIQEFGPPAEMRISEGELREELGKNGFRFTGRLELKAHYLHSYERE